VGLMGRGGLQFVLFKYIKGKFNLEVTSQDSNLPLPTNTNNHTHTIHVW